MNNVANQGGGALIHHGGMQRRWFKFHRMLFFILYKSICDVKGIFVCIYSSLCFEINVLPSNNSPIIYIIVIYIFIRNLSTFLDL